jgi:hypothetical protein
MRFLLFLLAFSASLLFTACKDKSTQPGHVSTYYYQMLFQRSGGGDLTFSAYPTSSVDTFNILIARKDFRDTTINLSITKGITCASVFDTLTQALNHRIELTGSFKQDTIPTGTWAHIYFVAGAEKAEVTNIELRNTLLKFEQMVRAKL